MDSLVFAAVLLAAAAHAGWNATIKRGLDPLLTTVLIAVGAGVVALPVLLFVGLPAAPAHPWVAASGLIHLAYFAGLIEAYRTGDMSQVYPIARGTAPLLTAIISTTWLGERRCPARLDRPPVPGRRRVHALAARRPRPRPARPPRARLRAVYRAHDLRLFGGRW